VLPIWLSSLVGHPSLIRREAALDFLGP
jgi:hypothetical protein